MKATIIVFVGIYLCFNAYADIDMNDCQTLNGGNGYVIYCPAEMWGIGSCGSGRWADCEGGHYTKLKCCREIINPSTNGKKKKEKSCQVVGSSGPGADVYCPGNMAVRALCGSGTNEDCHLSSGSFHTAIQCCDDHSLNLTSTCFWLYDNHGKYVECPAGAVARGICGSGKYQDCNGGNDSNGIYCCTYV